MEVWRRRCWDAACRRTKAAKVEPAVELLASINLQALAQQAAG